MELKLFVLFFNQLENINFYKDVYLKPNSFYAPEFVDSAVSHEFRVERTYVVEKLLLFVCIVFCLVCTGIVDLTPFRKLE